MALPAPAQHKSRRASRRQHTRRKKQRAKHFLTDQISVGNHHGAVEPSLRQVGIRARTPQLCSCEGCRNAGRILGAEPTRQEPAAIDREREQRADVVGPDR
jgi:hypothetical protein